MAVEMKEKTRHHEKEFENLDFLFKKLDRQLQRHIKRNADDKTLNEALKRDQEKSNFLLQVRTGKSMGKRYMNGIGMTDIS